MLGYAEAKPMRLAGPHGMDPHLRTLTEEIANSLTHGFGLLLSLAGGWFLLSRVLEQPDAWRLAGCGIFALTMVAVYAASTLSHAVARPAWRRAFRILDQAFRPRPGPGMPGGGCGPGAINGPRHRA